MKDHHAFDRLGRIESVDGFTLFKLSGITTRRSYDADGRIIAPVDGNRTDAAIDDSFQDFYKVAIESHQHSLSFRVTEARVVLDHLRTLGGEHQAYIQHPPEGIAFCIH